jgi:glutaminyl-peptide cyclotransferase
MRNYLLLLVATIAFVACSDDSKIPESKTKPKAQPAIRIKTSQSETLIYGDTIRFSVEATAEGQTINKVRVIIADTRKVVAESDNGKITIPTQTTGGGKLKLKIEADFEDGRTGTRYRDFNIAAPTAARRWTFEVVRKYPHDVKNFTQGLLMHNGHLYEGTGQYGESRLLKTELTTGKLLQEKAMDSSIFGEGITIYGDKLYQLSYKTGIGYVYNAQTFELIREFTFAFDTNEGWGLTHNENSLIASDGSPVLYFLDPVSLEETGRMRVFDDRGEITKINELEYHNGTIYANLWTTAEIIAIDAATGMVTDTYSARGMVDKSELSTTMDVLNGIAINPGTGNLIITGKYWTTLYEVRPVRVEEI